MLQKKEVALTFFNYLTREKEIFKPLKNKAVGLYACGPTVYDRVHIGNLRTYIFEDILKKTLVYNGYKVRHVMNITDIEDKIIRKMEESGKKLKQITRPYEKLFLEDVKKLNVSRADYLPRATAHVKEMIKIIEILLKKNFAYKGEDGSVYFSIKKFKNYGRLSQLRQSQLRPGARISADEYNKENVADFVLWKTAKANEPSWKTPFGNGRPGWHIECSAMSMKYLGKTFDIHAGAVDLLFPHHENEIAQSEAATGKKFVNYWVEGEHLLVNNKKMAKSLSNFFTLKDIEEKGINPLSFRYLALTTHYRSKLNFTWESLKSAEESLNNLKVLASKKQIQKTRRLAQKEKEIKELFLKALNNDLNTPRALAVVWETLRNEQITQSSKDKLVEEFDKRLSLGLKTSIKKIPANIRKMAREREKARQEKNWQKADELREKINLLGWELEDTTHGAIIFHELSTSHS